MCRSWSDSLATSPANTAYTASVAVTTANGQVVSAQTFENAVAEAESKNETDEDNNGVPDNDDGPDLDGFDDTDDGTDDPTPVD